jgi:type I restriction enzyme S subunit
MLSVYRDLGVVLREGRDDNFNKPGEDLGSYQVVRPGDLVLNKMKTWQGSLGISSFEGIVSPAYFVAEQVGDVEPRFIHHLLRSDQLIAEYGARSKGIRPNQWDLPWEEFRAIRVRLPGTREQQAIADYLDAETARIETAMSAREQQLRLLLERHGEAIMTLLYGDDTTPRLRLSRVVDLVPGYSFKSDEFLHEPGPVRLLRGINVDVGSLHWDDTVWASTATAAATERFELQAGDVVLGMDRPVISAGVRVAQVTADDLPALLVQRVARLRARSGLLQQYLWQVLRSPALAIHFEPVFTGVSVPHISPSQILSFDIPVPDARRQLLLAGELEKIGLWTSSLVGAIRRQTDLLAERRQALIAAAVTGQIEIPGVAA